MNEPLDILVIGGGVNGAGIARDAAGRGLKVMLVEAGDIGGGTSSASTKLIHGGLRYLEQYEFRLVRESLLEREVLWASAPHIIWPLRFVLPHHKGLRPRWLLRLGLFIYDHIGKRKRLPPTRSVALNKGPYAGILKPELRRGFEYSDCWVMDARLVALLARDAADRGARICPHTRAVAAKRHEGGWRVTVENADGQQETIHARTLVNAAGARVEQMVKAAGEENGAELRLVKGSHIVVPRLYEGTHCYIFQNSDGRIVFAIPYEEKYTLIGTTDTPFDDEQAPIVASDEEKAYLCAAVSEYLKTPVSVDQIVWSYAGVRPLYDDKAANAAAVTRDYVLDLRTDGSGGGAMLSIYGGKITTFRRLAEHALDKLAPYLPQMGPRWTASAFLPGGDIPNGDTGGWCAALEARYPWLSPTSIKRLARAYGSIAPQILGDAQSTSDLGRHFGADLYEAEVDYLCRREWARDADDILWRRSKLGLALSTDEQKALQDWLKTHAHTPA